MNRINVSSTSGRNEGFTLFEVLIALAVLSIGLLGLAALQTTSLRFNSGSYYRTQATYLAYDIIDRMRANRAAANNVGAYNVGDVSTVTTTGACDTAACTSSDLATYDIVAWRERAVQTLPNVLSVPPTIVIDASNIATVTISWTESDLQLSQSWQVQLCVPGTLCV